MKTTLHYSTFVTLSVYALGMTATVDMGCKPLNEIIDFIEHIYSDDTMFCGKYVQKVIATDTKTGELIAECEPDDPYDDWNYNEDIGYDPYLGCYTDDC